MTDESKPTYEELELDLAMAKDANTRLRKSSDDNYNVGREWKAQAEKLAGQIEGANEMAAAARIEAAELRGYIRRVNELDPKRVRQRGVNALDIASKMARRGY